MRKLHSFGMLMMTTKKSQIAKSYRGDNPFIYFLNYTQSNWKLGEVSTYQTLLEKNTKRLIGWGPQNPKPFKNNVIHISIYLV